MKTNTILVGMVIVLLMSNLFFGYMFFFHNKGPGFKGNFPQMQLDDEQIQNIKSFFESTANTNEIADYCNNQENKMSCFYYCREINSNHEYCSQLMQGRPDFQEADSQNVQKLN